MPYAVELVRILAWPTTTLAIVLLLRSEIRSFARTLSGRMESAKSIVLSHRGLEIRGSNDVVSLGVQRRRTKFGRFIKAISIKSDLDEISAILKIDPSSDMEIEKSNIVSEIGRIVITSDEMDAVSAILKEITGRDF